MATYTTVGITTFVLGALADGNKENRDFANGKSYDLDPTDSALYTTDPTEFPVI
jgi:hypothetical protein